MLHDIHKIRDFYFAHEKEIIVALLLILTGTLSYGLGRLSKIKESIPPITISDPTSQTDLVSSNSNETDSLGSREVTVSKNGKRYYYQWCGGLNNIKAENRKVFSSSGAAEQAGFTLAANCDPNP